jgi:hypothetical protein
MTDPTLQQGGNAQLLFDAPGPAPRCAAFVSMTSRPCSGGGGLPPDPLAATTALCTPRRSVTFDPLTRTGHSGFRLGNGLIGSRFGRAIGLTLPYPRHPCQVVQQDIRPGRGRSHSSRNTPNVGTPPDRKIRARIRCYLTMLALCNRISGQRRRKNRRSMDGRPPKMLPIGHVSRHTKLLAARSMEKGRVRCMSDTVRI